MQNNTENKTTEPLHIKQSEFITSATDRAGFIDDDFSQIVFAGKSNVGKSSLINSILQRKKLAKTSSTPGKTKLVNYFMINEAFYFVDLPGFGYAKVPVREKNKWKVLINEYLNDNKERIKVAISIIDIRHDPSENDKEMVSFFTSLGIQQILILSKSDKLSNNKVAQQKRKIENVFKNDTIIHVQPYSSLKNNYRNKMLTILNEIINID